MRSHFLEDVKIINFKCFKELHVENLKRVNLIGGKNNVGKTSFLEALEILSKPKSAFGLRNIVSQSLKRRQAKKNLNLQTQTQNFEFDFLNKLDLELKIAGNKTTVEIKYINVGETIYSNQISTFNPQIAQGLIVRDSKSFAHIPFLEFSLNEEKMACPFQEVIGQFQIWDTNSVNPNVNLISSCTTDEKQITVFYGELIESGREDYLDESLRLFDENIISLKPIPTEAEVVLKLRLKNKESLTLLSSLGEGINRYIAILCAIWASKDGYLFIDEIENGIHYTNHIKLWQIIFEASKMANCQVFATSHSKECIEAFNKANTMDEGAYIEFYRNVKTSGIEAFSRGYEQLAYSLTHGGEIRGE